MKNRIQRSLIASTFIITSLFASGAGAVRLSNLTVEYIQLRNVKADLVKVSGYPAGTIPTGCTLSGGGLFVLPDKVVSTLSTPEAAAFAQMAYMSLVSAKNNERKVDLEIIPFSADPRWCIVTEVFYK